MACPYSLHMTKQSRDLNHIQAKLYYDVSEGHRNHYR
jgi:hypothetical protein